jgi:hypothetical protein
MCSNLYEVNKKNKKSKNPKTKFKCYYMPPLITMISFLLLFWGLLDNLHKFEIYI